MSGDSAITACGMAREKVLWAVVLVEPGTAARAMLCNTNTLKAPTSPLNHGHRLLATRVALPPSSPPNTPPSNTQPGWSNENPACSIPAL